MSHDRVVARAPAAEKPIGVSRAGDANHQAAGREGWPLDGEATRRAERDDVLVQPEGRADEAEAVEEVDDAALHGLARYSVGSCPT